MNVEDGNESVGSINMPTLLVETKTLRTSLTTNGRLLQPCSVSSLHFFPYGTLLIASTLGPMAPTQQSRVIRGIRQLVAQTVGEHIAHIQEQVFVATVPLTMQVAQTSQIAQQTSALAREAFHQGHLTKETNAQVRGNVENVLCAYMLQIEQMTQQQLTVVAKGLVETIACASISMEEKVRLQRGQEIAKLCADLATLKSENVQGLMNVQTVTVTRKEELKIALSNVEQQLYYEQMHREQDQRWYKKVIEEMTKKHSESALQCEMIKQQLSKKDVQVNELLQTMQHMSSKMTELKQIVAQSTRRLSQPVGNSNAPTLAEGILDARSVAQSPQYPPRWITRNIGHTAQSSRTPSCWINVDTMVNTNPTPGNSNLVAENVGIDITFQDIAFAQPMSTLGQQNVGIDAMNLQVQTQTSPTVQTR